MSFKSISALILVGVVLSILLGVYFLSESSDNKPAVNELSLVQKPANKQVFEPVLPNHPVVLPNDFRFHPEYQHEWWHYFANVEDKKGNKYSVQWSYIRIASDERDMVGWQSPQLYISHIVVSNKHKVWKQQRIARGGIGQAGMIVRPFRLWLDNWSWRSLGNTPFPGQLDVQTDQFALQLRSKTSGPFALLGDKGYQKKHDLLPIASYNLSAPFLSVKGWLQLDKNRAVEVKGEAWMSKEWGTGLIAAGQVGWDWFVFDLNNDTTLTVSRYRHDQQMPYMFGTLMTKSGKAIALSGDEILMEPTLYRTVADGKQLPIEWAIAVPKHGIELNTKAINRSLWLPFVIPYWEGPIQTTGTHTANGFMQLTGY
ncbi:carotenoid 1,2-hydratase [Vibrio sp. SCSIO 43135]|nr:carotenoid 1,2-hydratase [Vibrio sp. SCSIO 43135]